jgi:hypothetical protein
MDNEEESTSLEVRYKEPVEILTKEQIKQLEDSGYDMKRLFYSSYAEIRQIRFGLEQQAIQKEIDKIADKHLLEIHTAQLEVTTDLRDITADEIIRTNQWRNDEIVRRCREKQKPGFGLVGLLIIVYSIYAVPMTSLFCAGKNLDPTITEHTETQLFKFIRITCPYVNLFYPVSLSYWSERRNLYGK